MRTSTGQSAGVMNTAHKVPEAMLQWYGHVRREHACIRRSMGTEVHGHCSRGRKRKMWIDVLNEDLKTLQLADGDAEDQQHLRKRIYVAAPSPDGLIPA